VSTRLSPQFAIGWEFWRRHRWGVRALGAYLALLAIVRVVIMARGTRVTFESETSFALIVVVPITVSCLYLLSVFTYGLSGDLAARQSMYPARVFALPLSTAALVNWPMLYGVAAMVGLWVLTRLLTVWPSDMTIPWVWPAVLGAALVMWTQALTWMPYGMRGVRVIVAVLVLWFIDAIVLLALHFKAAEWVIVAITAPQIPLAYAVARVALARARRGVVPAWRVPDVSRLAAPTAGFGRDSHGSAVRAQRWYEWRRHGKTLPAWVAIILPLELVILWAAGTSTALVIVTALGALATPIVVAIFAAVGMGSTGASRDSYGLSSFVATRPLTDVQLLAAKMAMTVRSTLTAWVLVALAVPAALWLSGTWVIAQEWAQDVAQIIGTPRALVALALIVAGMMLSTWRQLVQGLCVGLTGNERLIKGIVFGSVVVISLLGPLAVWIIDTKRLGVVWSAMPVILTVLVCAKMLAAAVVESRLARGRSLSDRALFIAASCWTIAVLGVYALLAWVTDTPHIPRYLVMLVAILFVPLARLTAAPLAIAWNRHGWQVAGAGWQGAAGRSRVAGRGSRVTGGVLGIIALPLVAVPFQAAQFHRHNRDNGSMVSSGIERSYLLHVPARYDPAKPTPLVLSFHGAGLWGAAQRDLSRWDEVSDEEGFIVVYPSGVGGRGIRVWHAEPGNPRARDNLFVAELIDTLRSRYNIDTTRIYANGLSNGGGMSFGLSCALSRRIAAVGLVGSAQTEPWHTCTDTTPVPMINFHGTDDRFAAYRGGKSWVLPHGAFPSQLVWTARWAARNHCAMQPVDSVVTADVNRRSYSGCSRGADVVLYTIVGGGHTWPGGGAHPAWFVGTMTRSIDASRVMWRFFRDHPLRR